VSSEERLPSQDGFFDLDERYRRLSASGDLLGTLSALIDFEGFRPRLDAALWWSDGAKGGRQAYDAVMMFKVLVLKTLLNDVAELQIRNRLSFMRFLGLGMNDPVPDAMPCCPRSALPKTRQSPGARRCKPLGNNPTPCPAGPHTGGDKERRRCAVS
jgi:hypothetical protein